MVSPYRDAQAAQRNLANGRMRSGVAAETTSSTQEYSDQYYNLKQADDRAYVRGDPWGEEHSPFAVGRSRSYGYDYNDDQYDYDSHFDAEYSRGDSYYDDDWRDSGSYYDDGSYHYDDYDGGAVDRRWTEAVVYYTLADISLRVAAFWLFSHAAGDTGYQWLALWAYVSGHTLISRTDKHDSFRAILNALGASLVGLFPLLSNATPRYAKAETLYSTAFCAACVLAALYLPSLPMRYTDDTVRLLGTGFVGVATSVKLAASAYKLWPAAYGDR